MEQTSTLAAAVQKTIDAVFEKQRAALQDLGPDVVPILDQAEQFLRGGKRLRAQFAVAGYRSIASVADPMLDEIPSSVIAAAASLELFHAAALVHDDIIDRSDTRRGAPAVHKWFTHHHLSHSWRSDADAYGVAAAILIGDLLQTWADELFSAALEDLPHEAANAARTHFNRMRTEVAAGQYLDVLEEQLGAIGDEATQLERATRVLVYKSAKYSVEAPLLIGAALAGANADQESIISDFGLPIGVAFQLRDDLLGVFGDEEVTGKPAGDDLREGKQTILVAVSRQHLQTSTRQVFDELLGDSSLDSEQVTMLQRTIQECGAVDIVEQMIEANLARARKTLADSSHKVGALSTLESLADKATRRSF